MFTAFTVKLQSRNCGHVEKYLKYRKYTVNTIVNTVYSIFGIYGKITVFKILNDK